MFLLYPSEDIGIAVELEFIAAFLLFSGGRIKFIH